MKKMLFVLVILLAIIGISAAVEWDKEKDRRLKAELRCVSLEESFAKKSSELNELKLAYNKAQNDLSFIHQIIHDVDIDYITKLPGGIDLKMQMIRQTINGDRWDRQSYDESLIGIVYPVDPPISGLSGIRFDGIGSWLK